jgi:hypothetical protein
MQTYTIYTQCDHCGIYDRNPQWCALCQRPKSAKRREIAKAPVADPQKADGASAGGLAGVSHDLRGKVGYPLQDEEDSAGIPYIPRGQPTMGSA